MKNARRILAALLWLVPAVAHAHGSDGHPADPNLHVDPTLEDCSVIFAPGLTQDAYARFVREFGSVSAFKMLAPPTTLGRGHVALAVEQISFAVEDKSAAWNDTFAHPDAYHELGSRQTFPKVRLRVGLNEDVDVGAFWTRNPDANYGWLGVEARYAMLRQDEAKPVSLALRGAYTKTLYVRDMDMHALTLDAAAGRTFGRVFTPYVGVGSDWILARETSNAVELETEMQDVPHALGGFELRLGPVAFGAEAQLAELTSYQLQVSGIF